MKPLDKASPKTIGERLGLEITKDGKVLVVGKCKNPRFPRIFFNDREIPNFEPMELARLLLLSPCLDAIEKVEVTLRKESSHESERR